MTTEQIVENLRTRCPQISEATLTLAVSIYAVLKTQGQPYKTASGETVSALRPAEIKQELRDRFGYGRLPREFGYSETYVGFGYRVVKAQYVGGVRAKQACEVIVFPAK